MKSLRQLDKLYIMSVDQRKEVEHADKGLVCDLLWT